MIHKEAKEKAEEFLIECIHDGLAHSYDTITGEWVKPYPEVTGYLLTYFSQKHTVPEKIIEAGEKLLKLQDAFGGFSTFYNADHLYTFDTAQIVHGFASLYAKTKDGRFLRAAIRGGEFLLSMQHTDGSFFPMYHKKHRCMEVEQLNTTGTNWGSCFSPIQVKNAEALLLLHKLTRDHRFAVAAKRSIVWGKKHLDQRYTHPFGYFLEGMYAGGEKQYVQHALYQHINMREHNGFIAYKKGVSFAYASGSIQLGILCAKTGNDRLAKRIHQWAEKLQAHHDSGGLFQYANADATPNTTIHAELNSWGTKYFCELSSCLHLA